MLEIKGKQYKKIGQRRRHRKDQSRYHCAKAYEAKRNLLLPSWEQEKILDVKNQLWQEEEVVIASICLQEYKKLHLKQWPQ